MGKNKKEAQMNLYYMNQGQAKKTMAESKAKKQKEKEREKRLREKKQINANNEFELETETVIQMTNRNRIKKEEQKRKQLTKQEIKRKKRNKKIKFFLKLFVFISLITGAIIFALTSPIFNIREIKVFNNSQVPADTIISLSELKTEENIFKFYGGNIINKIKENPYIENVKVHRKLPNIVEINIEERIAQYSVEYIGKYAYVNTQGYILEISEDSKEYPIIQGITTTEGDIIQGNRLNNEDLSRLEDVIKIMSAARENGLDVKVTTIDISNKNEYSIYLEEEKKKVYLGDNTNLSNKMLYVVAIIEQEKEREGDIFINGDLNNKFQPYFREKV